MRHTAGTSGALHTLLLPPWEGEQAPLPSDSQAIKEVGPFSMQDFDRCFKNPDLYWNPRKTRSYNSLYNFIIGMRGGGKTFGALALTAERFLSGKGKFVYVRRYCSELEDLTNGKRPNLYSKLQKFVPEHKFKCENDMMYIDEQHAGWAVPLSTSNIKKSFDMDDVDTILFDEFIIDNSGVYHYLRNEVNLFNTLYQTIVRDLNRFVPVFFLSNAVSVSNPYFDFYHLDRPMDGASIRRFGKNKRLLVESVVPKENVKRVKRSAWYEIMADTEYADYAVENKWLMDNTDFIEHKTKNCVYYMTLRYNGHEIGIWQEPQDWIYYVSRDVDDQYPRKYSVTTDDHKPNVLLFSAAKHLGFMEALRTAYEYGCVRYESMQLKNEFKDIMRMCRMYR